MEISTKQMLIQEGLEVFSGSVAGGVWLLSGDARLAMVLLGMTVVFGAFKSVCLTGMLFCERMMREEGKALAASRLGV